MKSMIALFVFIALACVAQGAVSEWVCPGSDGKLVYKTTAAGDRIMDFSNAGYMGGGVTLPEVPVKITVKPVEGDCTAAIQEAIDKVSAMPLEGGFRGAVLLAPGDYTCSGTVSIRAGGVVLRGSGSGPGGSTIKMVGGRHGAIAVGGGGGRQTTEDGGQAFAASSQITDAYVPSGTKSFTVTDASGFAVGDTISIRRPVTEAWLKFMQMDNLTRDGRPQTWIRAGTTITTERMIVGVSGNQITLDIPLTDSFDSKYLNPPGTAVVKVRPSATVAQSGVEYIHIQAPPQHMSYSQAPYTAMRISGEDCWARDILIEETMNSVSVGGRRITLERVAIHRTVPNLGASKPAEFAPNAGQVLLDRCTGNGDNIWHVATGGGQAGPIVLLNCTFHGAGHIEGHQRWTTGMLLDNCQVPEGGIDIKNRGAMGSGHGWGLGWSVAWNCVAKTYVVQQPPGVFNWMIGCIGENVPTPRPFDQAPTLPLGTCDSPGKPVEPKSLYLAQLAERLGPQALKNIGYSPDGRSLLPEVVYTKPGIGRSREVVDKELGLDVAAHKLANPSNVRGGDPTFGGERALDGDPNTYWTTNEGVTQASLEVDLEEPAVIGVVDLREAKGLGQRVEAYRVEGQVDSDWKLLSEGTTIGERQVDHFPPVLAWKVRLRILKASVSPAISTFGLYSAAPVRIAPTRAQPPQPLEPLPSARQLEWQENELTLFCHFGMNTFTGRSTGLGDEDPNLFNPTELDCLQWATVAKETGFKGIILTAKHHDGFCIWPTKTTQHSVASSRWKDGKGDVVRELAEACKQTGIKLGIYCSPWDRSQGNYTQDKAAYSRYYQMQLTELMSNYGPIFEMWLDGNRADVDSWPEVIRVIRSLQPQTVIKQGPFVAPVREDVRWVGNSEAKAPLTNWSVYLSPDQPADPVRIWLPLECDIPMVGNWFWNDRPPMSLDDLLNLYYWTVGRNSMLLLNVAPDKRGKFSDASVARLQEFHAALTEIFSADLALNKPAKASSVRGGDPAFGPGGAVDGNKETYWATDDGVTTGWLEVDLGAPQEFNVVRMEEFIQLGQRVCRYKIEAEINGQTSASSVGSWKQIADGTTIGYRKLDRFPKVKASKVRLTIEEARACPTVKSFGVHLDSVSDPKNFEPAVALSMSSRRINRFPATAPGAQHEFEPAGSSQPSQPASPSRPRASGPAMVIESLNGPVTPSEIDSFKAYMKAQSPPSTPWGSSHNAWAFGSGGRNLEAMGMMYEVSGDVEILNTMVAWADECVSQRNDFMPAERGGQRVMWTGKIEKVWCPESATNRNAKYAGCETEDAIAHMIYCAKLILQHSELWKTTVPDDNPHGYGVTYKDRALNYIAKCDESNDEYFVKWFIQPDTHLIRDPENQPVWKAINNNLNAINRQMMFDGGFQRLAECHEILGDAPERVKLYDAIVKTSVEECLKGIKTFQPGVVDGHKVYNWHYFPWSKDTKLSESTGHAAYDALGLYRAFQRPAYGLELEDLMPIANTMAYVIYKGDNTFAATVDGKGALKSFAFGELMLLADWNPDVYEAIGKSVIASGNYARNANFAASILYMKHRRAAGLCPVKTAPETTAARGAWFNEARFGLFLHWGLYAVPAGEYGNNRDHGEWIQLTAKIPNSEYERNPRT